MARLNFFTKRHRRVEHGAGAAAVRRNGVGRHVERRALLVHKDEEPGFSAIDLVTNGPGVGVMATEMFAR